jgi:hypothetical protein
MISLVTFLKNFLINNSSIDIYDIKTGEMLLSARQNCSYLLFDENYYIQRIENNSNAVLSIYVIYMEDK